MERSLSLLSSTINLLSRLSDHIKKYQKAKKTKKRLLVFLDSRIDGFTDNFEEMQSMGEDRFFPTLQSFDQTPTTSKINEIVECVSDFNFLYAKLHQSFVELVKGCYDLSSHNAFMDSLKESSDLLSDFVSAMKNTLVTKGEKARINVDSRFYSFLQLYGDDILKDLDSADIEEVVDQTQVYIDIVNKKLKPSLTSSAIRRKARQKFRNSLKQLHKASKKIKVERTTLLDLRSYVPAKLQPLAIMIEETFPIEEPKEALLKRKRREMLIGSKRRRL